MSTIDGLNGNSAVSAYQYSGTNAVAGQSQNSQQGPGAAGASKFADAISAALSQVTGSSSSTGTTASSTSGTSDSSQAEATFAQNLFAALQSQAGGAAASGTGSTAASGGTAPAGGHHHHHGGGGGKISSGLDSLASQLTASSSDSNTSTTDSSDSTGSDPLSALQASFNNLLAANGQSASSASLPQFLQTLSQNLQNAPATGNVVSTKV